MMRWFLDRLRCVFGWHRWGPWDKLTPTMSCRYCYRLDCYAREYEAPHGRWTL